MTFFVSALHWALCSALPQFFSRGRRDLLMFASSPSSPLSVVLSAVSRVANENLFDDNNVEVRSLCELKAVQYALCF